MNSNIVGNEIVEQSMSDLQNPSILIGCMVAPRSPAHMEFFFFFLIRPIWNSISRCSPHGILFQGGIGGVGLHE